MTSTLISKVLLVASGAFCVSGCSGTEVSANPFTHPPGLDQGTGVSTAGTGGSSSEPPGIAGPFPEPGAAGADNDVTKVWNSNGCGKAYEGPIGNTKITLLTTGAKEAMCNDKLQNGTPRCGAWGEAGSEWLAEPLRRDYYLYLPQGYDPTKAYPIVFQGPGCGGNGTQVHGLNGSVGNTVIRVGLTPAPSGIIGHGCCPFDCFDDHEGDDSVDWVFYENLYDKLNDELCFDRNRVFASGTSSGAAFANQVACKYAGDSRRPVRAPMPNSGYWPISPTELPTCTQAPMAGMSVSESDDPELPLSDSTPPINRVLTANGCGAADYASAPKESFPIGGGQAADRCKRITGCNPLYPLVVCELTVNRQGSHDETVNPGFATFIKLFSAGALLAE